METMIKRMAAVALMAFVGLGLAVSPSFAAEDPAPSACDTLTLDPDAMFAYAATVTIPEGSHAVEFCEVYQQNVPAGKFVFTYEAPTAGFRPTMS